MENVINTLHLSGKVVGTRSWDMKHSAKSFII